jgi:sugar/nucleoside kinase (ribokinase family)
MNAVLGGGADKLILKSVLEAPPEFDSERLGELAWLCDCAWVLVNSPKERAISEYLASQARRDGPRLCVVFTASPSPAFVWGSVLPFASAVITSWDEAPAAMGWEADLTVSGAAGVLGRLRMRAPDAILYVTMGAEGVLVSEPGCALAHWVRLGPGLWGPCSGGWRPIRRRCAVWAMPSLVQSPRT